MIRLGIVHTQMHWSSGQSDWNLATVPYSDRLFVGSDFDEIKVT